MKSESSQCLPGSEFKEIHYLACQYFSFLSRKSYPSAGRNYRTLNIRVAVDITDPINGSGSECFDPDPV